MRRLSDQAKKFIEKALAPPSIVERSAIGHIEALQSLANLGETAAIPALLWLLPTENSTSREAARTIITLWKHVTPSDLGWIDEQARHCVWTGGYYPSPWVNLEPAAVLRLARFHTYEPVVLGLLGCHSNRHVREVAVKELASVTNGGDHHSSHFAPMTGFGMLLRERPRFFLFVLASRTKKQSSKLTHFSFACWLNNVVIIVALAP
jgi:hypothetical protein